MPSPFDTPEMRALRDRLSSDVPDENVGKPTATAQEDTMPATIAAHIERAARPLSKATRYLETVGVPDAAVGACMLAQAMTLLEDASTAEIGELRQLLGQVQERIAAQLKRAGH